MLGLDADKDFNRVLRDAGVDASRYLIRPIKDGIPGSTIVNDSQNAGREDLAGPSEIGAIPDGQFLAIIPKGGGYYYIPPIPNTGVKDNFFTNGNYNSCCTNYM